MNGMHSFWILLILLAAWPLVLVGLFTLWRRFPSGLPVQKRWMFWGALAAIYLASSAFFFVTGANTRGISFLALGIAAVAYALDQRRRSATGASV